MPPTVLRENGARSEESEPATGKAEGKGRHETQTGER